MINYISCNQHFKYFRSRSMATILKGKFKYKKIIVIFMSPVQRLWNSWSSFMKSLPPFCHPNKYIYPLSIIHYPLSNTYKISLEHNCGTSQFLKCRITLDVLDSPFKHILNLLIGQSYFKLVG